MNDSTTDVTAERVRALRMLRGMTQRELAAQAEVSYRTVQTVEQGLAQVRISTVRQLARALNVKTAELLQSGLPERPDPMGADRWEDMRAALYRAQPGTGVPAQAREVFEGLRAIKPDLAVNRYDRARAVLPGLIRDAAALDGAHAMTARSRVWNATSWLLTQSRQWDDALTVGRRALDAAENPVDKIAAANTLCWCLLRQGRLAEGSALAVEWADRMEPGRFSRADPRVLAGWGKLWLYVANSAVRNNEPGGAAEAMANAMAAAVKIGREVETDPSTTRTFGPVTAKMIEAETALLADKPDKVLAIKESIPAGELVHAQSASVLRSRLDEAAAHAELKHWGESVDVLDDLRRNSPQWLRYQRPARDVMERVMRKRRSLTATMKDVADAVGISLPA